MDEVELISVVELIDVVGRVTVLELELLSVVEPEDVELVPLEIVEPVKEPKVETRIGGPRTSVTVGVGPP